jgi:hypothetical protein
MKVKKMNQETKMEFPKTLEKQHKNITHRITTPPKNPRKDNSKIRLMESPLLHKTPEKPTHNSEEKFQRKEKKRYLAVVVSEDMSVKENFCSW